jgi:hypothetical protein
VQGEQHQPRGDERDARDPHEAIADAFGKGRKQPVHQHPDGEGYEK